MLGPCPLNAKAYLTLPNKTMNTMVAIISRSLLLASSIVGVCSLAPPQQHAVVVGAGPAGMAAALTLATHHNYTVTLLESSPPSSAQTKYDPTKAFLYNVNGRGQTLTKQFPNMQKKLEERSVGSQGPAGTSITIVPADPTVEIPMQKSTAFDGDSKDKDEMNNGNAAAKKEGGSLNVQDDKAKARGYWLPRHEMVNLMSECIDEHNSQNDSCKIEVLMGQECVDVLPTKNVACVKVRNAKDGSLQLLEAKLVVGADGMNSKVRESLARAPDTLWRQSASKGKFNPKKFLLKKWTSPASHLRIKVLQLPPQFEIPNAPGFPAVKTNSEDIYAFRSVNTGPRDYLSLGLLPMKDNNAVRPTNIVTRPNHEVWEIKDGATMQAYLQKAFPRFNFSKGGMISDEEFERFAKAEGTRFPPCQFSEGLAVWDESGTCGVALVGDAIHAFSPDIGQGVNAGLVDVACLDRALRGLDTTTGKEIEQPGKADKKESLQTSLERYQKEHAPEIAALIRLARFGAPYQYNQPHRADRILKKFWTANVVLRLLLNKLTFGLVQPQCIILAGNNDLTFRQVMRRADLTTALFKTILVGVLGLWVKQRFGFGFLKALF